MNIYENRFKPIEIHKKSIKSNSENRSTSMTTHENQIAICVNP